MDYSSNESNEIKRLKRENAKLKEENEILKKATNPTFYTHNKKEVLLYP